MKTIKLNLFLLALAVISSTVTYAQEVVTDSIGTTQASVKTVEALLQGQVAGVRVWSMDGSPMSASGISIRGVNSIRGGHQPLFVVDGTILNGSNTRNIDPLWQYPEEGYINPLSQLGFLAPNDIESIEVLKNSTATALYGSRGANGVVIIRTKRASGEKSSVVWDSNLDYSTPEVSGYARPSFSHNHKVMVGSMKNKTGYTLSAYLRDNNYILPGTGSMWGGLRALFETKANDVVWFGLNSNVAVGNNHSAAAAAWYGQQSLTQKMRDPQEDLTGWANDYDDDVLEFRTINSMWLQLNFFEGFSFKFDLGTDFQSHNRYFWWGNGTELGLARNGVAAHNKTRSFSYNASGVFKYARNIDGHNFAVSAGAEVLGNWDILNVLNGSDFFNHSLRAKSLNIAASKAMLHQYDLKFFNLGVFATASYDYEGKAGVDLALRNDYNPEVKHLNVYPSVSAFWDVKETFFPEFNAVSTVKVTGGYGESGLDSQMPYDFIGNFTTGEYYEADPTQLAFYDARNYIHNKEWNVALNLGLANDRVNIEAGYFQRRTTDNLSIYGFGYRGLNDTFMRYIGRRLLSYQESEVKNYGFEYALNVVPVKTSNWTWSINFNGAFNASYISSIAKADEGGKSIGQGIVATRNKLSYPVSSIVDKNGIVLGNPTPRTYGGLSTTLTWKDLSFDMLSDYATGFDILNLNAMTADKAAEVSEKYVEKGDFFRLARIALSYKIPVENVKWMDSFKVFASANNLAVKTDYTGWSPDVNSFAASNYRLGIDSGSYPAAKSFVLGLSIKF